MHLVRWDLDLVTLLCLMSTLELQSWASEVSVYPPQESTVILNQNFTYTCNVSGDKPSFIKWFHNDKELLRQRADVNYHIRKKGRTLHFKHVKVVNRGWYYCRAILGSSAVNSTKVLLTVHVVSVYPPRESKVIFDQSFTYTCNVYGDKPSFIKWFHKDRELLRKGADVNYSIRKKGRILHFNQVKVVNRGEYYCRAVHGSSADNSTKVKLIVHVPAEIIKTFPLSRNKEVSAGSVITITCEAAAIPPPVVEWRRNGNLILKNQSNPHEVQTEHNTSIVSLSSSLRIIASQSAVYSCSAINSPLGIFSNDSASINIRVIPTTADAITPRIPDTEVCAPYNGTTCRAYLQGRLVLHNASEPIEQRDAALEAQLQALVDLGLFSDIMDGRLCEDPARRLLCHMTFPDCHNETHQALPICQESCEAVKSVFCFRHLAVLEGMKTEQKLSGDIGLLSLPDCPTLPSKWNSSQLCVESDHHGFSPSLVRDDCYMEKGRWYNGTVSSTISGFTCQAWVDTSPQKHDRSPLIFPELIGAENFCRNPAGEEGRPWCYTTDTQHRWEECNIKMCSMYDRDDDMKLVYIIGSCGLVTVCFSIGILVFLVRHCHRTRNTASRKGDVDVSVENLPLNSAYHQMKSNRLNPKLETLEFPRNDIVFIEDIGQGAFGRVFKARLVCSGGNCHIRGGKLSDSKHSLSSGKNCKHKNIFSKGDIRPLDTSPYSKYYDSKLLGEHLSMLCEHNKDFGYKDCDLVAVKMLKEDASETIQADFEREASLMVEFDHVNIVRLLGVCTIGRPMCLLFEYMSKGDLNEFLRLCSPDQCLRRGNTESNPSLQDTSSITIQDQLHMARQIACGMLYLSERGYVHRDLATRNCLIGDNLIVKISDFGLARSVHSMDYYHGSDKDAIPVRWMPPEAILYNKFSTQSDVWSFGVLLWEIFSFAIQPYYGMTHEEVVDYLRAGKVLPAPDYGPSSVYELMKSCWHRKPLSRPTFVALHKSLNVIYEEISKLKLMNVVNL